MDNRPLIRLLLVRVTNRGSSVPLLSPTAPPDRSLLNADEIRLHHPGKRCVEGEVYERNCPYERQDHVLCRRDKAHGGEAVLLRNAWTEVCRGGSVRRSLHGRRRPDAADTEGGDADAAAVHGVGLGGGG